MIRRTVTSLKNLTAAVLLLGVVLVMAEIGVGWLAPPVPPAVTSQVKASLQQLLVPSATRHHELRRSAQLQIPGGPQFRTSSLGLRQTPGLETTSDTLRVLFLGDEAVLSARVEHEEPLPGRLEQFLGRATQRNVHVINGGIPGYSPLLSWLAFRHELHRLKPDVVILHFDMSDVTDDAIYRRRLISGGHTTVCGNALLDDFSDGVSPLTRHVRDSALVRTALQSLSADAKLSLLSERYQWTLGNADGLKLRIQHAMEPLQKFADAAKEQGFSFLVTTSPVPWQVAASDSFSELASQLPGTDWPVTESLPAQILNAACRQYDVELCDPADAFRSFADVDRLFIGFAVELSAYGNALYAREIAAKLIKTPRFAALFERTGVAAVSDKSLSHPSGKH